jgi:hypothetical protein
MNNLERRLRRLEEHHGACSHRNDRGFPKPLLNPTEEEVERYKKDVAECPRCQKVGGPLQILIIECPDFNGLET